MNIFLYARMTYHPVILYSAHIFICLFLVNKYNEHINCSGLSEAYTDDSYRDISCLDNALSLIRYQNIIYGGL